MKRNNTLWAYFFLGPQLLGLLAFALIPLGFAFVLSFMHWDGFGDKTFAGLVTLLNNFKIQCFIKHYGIQLYIQLFIYP